MAILPVQLARVSNLLRTNVSGQAISRTQRQLLEVQNELATGKRLNAPSDDPGDAAAVVQLQKLLEQRAAYADNIAQAKSHLGEVDTTLGDLANLMREAQTIASANVGSDVTADQRSSAAALVQNLFNQAVSLGNKQFNGTYLFGGDRATDPPFVEADGSVRFVGSSTVLANRIDESTDSPFMVDGADVFGAVSTKVKGTADLSPRLADDTRLSDLRGATGDGVRPGMIQIGNGTTTAVVDLSRAGTVGDVVNAINAAGVGGITASAGPGAGLTLSGGPGDDITVADVGGGSTSADLGIRKLLGGGAGAPFNGASTNPRVTAMTRLADLRGGAGMDLAGGLTIRNGAASATVALMSPPLRSPATVEDLLNAINGSGTDVLARINDAGTGIDIVNPSQGAQMSIGENGGTTASDLGVRSFTASTPLSELNGGRGVRTAGGDDFSVTRTDGTSFTVDLDGAATVQDVIDRINAADTANGTLPARVVASLSAVGNGITLTDSAGGAGAVALVPLNFSDAVKDLGLSAAPSGGGTTIVGTDVNPVAPRGIFGHLATLRDALEGNDAAAITAMAEGLQADHDRVVRIRGTTGARVQELEARHERLEDQNVATEALLSELADTDFTEAITRFQTLQTALQGTLQTAGRAMNLSLLDFLG